MEEFYTAKRKTGDIYLYTENHPYAIVSVEEFKIFTGIVVKENEEYTLPVIKNKYYIIRIGDNYFITNSPRLNCIYLYPHPKVNRIPYSLMPNLNLPETISGITPLTEEELKNLFKF